MFSRVLLAAFSGTIILSCGSSKESEKKRLDANTVSLSVPPGTYEHGVVVIFKKSDDGTGSGVLEIQKPDGTWGFASSECNGGVETGATCVTVNSTKTIKYRLATISGESSEKEASYVINPKTNNLTINSSQFNESTTDCYTSGTDKKLKGRVKLTNDDVLTSSKVAYVHFGIDYTTLNNPLTVTSGTDNGISVKGSGDNAPDWADIHPGGGSSQTDKCIVTLTTFQAGQKAAGEIECSLSSGTFSTQTPLGSSIIIAKGVWQCDSWKSVLDF